MSFPLLFPRGALITLPAENVGGDHTPIFLVLTQDQKNCLRISKALKYSIRLVADVLLVMLIGLLKGAASALRNIQGTAQGHCVEQAATGYIDVSTSSLIMSSPLLTEPSTR